MANRQRTNTCPPLGNWPSANPLSDEVSGFALPYGRLIGPTLADPEIRDRLDEVEKRLFPNREATVQFFVRLGIVNEAGELTKEYGGS